MSKSIKLFFKSTLIAIFAIIGMIIASANTVEAKELNNVISDVIIWDVGNGREASKNAQGEYILVKDASYRFSTNFDLADYNNNVENGDFFTFNIPAPFNLEETSFDMIDKETGIAIGAVKVTSNGAGNGGSATVTIQNLDAYLEQKKTTEVINVTGDFFAQFTMTETLDKTTIVFENMKDIGQKEVVISVIPRASTDNTETLKKENFAKYGGVLRERPYTSDALGKSGQYQHPWRIRLNASQKQYDFLTITDYVNDSGAPMQFIPETLVVSSGDGINQGYQLNNRQILTEGVDYTITYDSSYTKFDLTINNPGSKSFMIDYATTAPADGSVVINSAQVLSDKGDLTITDDRTETVTNVTRNSRVANGGTINIETGNRITIYKTDLETGEALAGAVFKITKPDGSEITLTATDDANGITQSPVFSEAEMAAGEFTITEITAPDGYILSSDPIKVIVTDKGVIRTITNKKGKTSITGQKTWNDNNNQDGKRPKEVTIKLLADGVDTGKTATTNEAQGWTYTFNDLDVVNAQGQDIVYTVEEVAVPEYDTMVNGYDITNTHTPSTTKVSGTKTWNDSNNQDGKRPTEIVVNLLADGQPTGQTATVNEASNWAYEFTDLPEFKDGQKIVYSVTEEVVPEYTTEINGFDITNSYNPGKTSLSVTKVWNDANNQDGVRPDSIKVQLYANDKKSGKEVTLTAADNWTYTWTDLAQKAKGKDIVYSVKEVGEVTGYTTEITETSKGNVTITNTHTPSTIKVSGTKTWDDNNNQDGLRPTEIVVNLLANGQPTGQTVTVNETSNWAYEFTNLPEFKDGQKVVYTVTENKVDNYTVAIDGYNITNSYQPGKTSVTVSKTWDDANNQDGIRPDSIKVQLYANDQKIGDEVTLTATDNWTYTWSDLDEKSAGQTIVYTVKEVGKVDGYTVSLGEMNQGNVTITNTHTPSVIKVEGKKTWDDADNKDGLRPESITVRLYANGKEVKHVEVTAKDKWSYRFENLPEYENGKKIEYSLSEDAVKGYTTVIKSYDITNVHHPEKPLPKTGESNKILFSVLGFAILAIVGFIVYRVKRSR
ncbi:Cna B-type domain-containing protein [Streptococcus pacificus]|uniref:Cna B-type domain-containing protein n=1 Tax=Streptococcus pacificus TaxID=2740577 RepID=A0ABS0ZK19_9STRE|nr:Cna B-type domain-containing protein [Streptococcus pacificus]MBJ8326359.1 Cna B-type domain-containing protein [Streptococcus pacificus]